MSKQIIRRTFSQTHVDALMNLPPVLRRIYAARQITSREELEHGLDHLLPYQSLSNIDEAVHILADTIFQQKKILIVGDFDADGATSTAVAVRALRSFGALHVNYLVPNRFSLGYGLTPELVKMAVADDAPQLIVTVDNGIANHAGVEAAKAAGMRVIITDHHLPASTLPPADAIVNPNQVGDVFPSKQLAGVGVIFYVMLALRRKLLQEKWFDQKKVPEPVMSRLLDLVALGTVADLVPLDQNNRILVEHGLRRIRSGQCSPGIIALLELSNRDFGRVVASDLGFAVASRLNAAGRLDDMSLGIECLLCDDTVKVRAMARTLDQLNEERKGIEQDMQAKALAALKKVDWQSENLPKGLCLYDETWHQGVIGLLASRIKEKFHRPVIVFAPGQDKELKGSARSIPGFHVRDALASVDAQCPGMIMKFGGHAMAAGLTIQLENLSQFRQIFDTVVSSQVTAMQLEHHLLSDGALSEEEFTLSLATALRDAGPFGQGFPEPLFDDHFDIVEQRIVGDKHLKLRLKKGQKMLEAIAFFVDTTKWPNHRCQAVHAAYRLDVNEYKGRKNIQLIVDYLEAK